MRRTATGSISRRTSIVLCLAAAIASACATQSASGRTTQASSLPERLSDSAYWALLSDVSEPGGYFRIEDNYTSNEMEIGQLFSMIRGRGITGDVYLGVGPEQNYTYIAAIRPKMAFIIDIRRQAVIQHLMFKAIYEMAADRADFVSLLFSKPRPPGLDSTTPVEKLWAAYRMVRSDSSLAMRTYDAVLTRLTQQHRFALDQQELAQLEAVFRAFYYYGPQITTRGPPSGRGGDFSTLTGFSLDSAGNANSFLSTEENYRFVKSLHDRNLIVPVSGDFAGPKAIRAIGEYLREHNAVVRAFYVSNVEQYLFGDGKDRDFYANVAALPADNRSVFIRPYSLRRWFRGAYGTADEGPTESLCPIASFLRAANEGKVTSNNAALGCPQASASVLPRF